ncbi:peptidyl-prolyl cis-trans isomerase FKBP4-like isoform X2 [Ostrea edulis]|uniref:peptidyl-prolyl cis-trans isomerase FKBP4-like isoform X2 n=1 Tax=Ostrea edulis TaxID=37623 RepID=UPI0024AEC68B|nr:peptidyl-prolyl cis-trans isomerase FKBP4-like isoform X2 [Ostrea edulis]
MTQEVYEPTDITPDKDGGVIKQILRAGDGNESPVPGDKVSVHYVGTLDDETQFDSSRERGQLFEFDLGQGKVIKAWDLGIATMKKGELAKFTCQAKYAYGEVGSLPKIPANATLIFEVELFSWKGEDLSMKNDESIIRHITTKGRGWKNPNEGAMVKVHYVGRHGENVFEDREVEFNIGDGVMSNVIEGLEIALKRMKEGEKCRLDIKPSMAYGSKGNPDLGVPPDADLVYDVELRSFENVKENWEMEPQEKLEQSRIAKEKGTKFFKEGNYKVALKYYDKCQKNLEFETTLSGEDEEKKKEMILLAHLNMAMCCLKIDQPAKVRDHCNKALELDDKCVKAYFRRGQAYFAGSDFDLAKKDFEKVCELEPDNKASKNQVKICEQKIKHFEKKEKARYVGMFDKFAAEDAKKTDEDKSKDGESKPAE